MKIPLAEQGTYVIVTTLDDRTVFGSYRASDDAGLFLVTSHTDGNHRFVPWSAIRFVEWTEEPRSWEVER